MEIYQISRNYKISLHSNHNRKKEIYILLFHLLIVISHNPALGCRSSVDEDRVPIMSHHVSLLIIKSNL